MTELVPAEQLAAKAHRPYPGESAAYTKARTALLASEVELRRQIEAVAAERRALPEADLLLAIPHPSRSRYPSRPARTPLYTQQPNLQEFVVHLVDVSGSG